MYRHSRNRIFPFSGWLACENHWNLRVVSPTPYLYPTRNAHFWFKRKKKSVVYLYIWTTQARIICIYFNSDCTFDFVFGLYQIPKICGNCSLLSGPWLSRKKFSLCGWKITGGSWNTFLKRWLVNHLLSGNNWEEKVDSEESPAKE